MATAFNHNEFLMVPTRLDALIVDQGGMKVLEPFARFDRLPYSRFRQDGKRTRLESVNYDQPYISETVFSKPFYNNNNQLEPGVHLHWSLPDALTIARKWHPRDSMRFPAVPDRWLVVRYRAGSNTPDKKWMVLSNYLWPEGIQPDFIPRLKHDFNQIDEFVRNKLLSKLQEKGSVAKFNAREQKALYAALNPDATFLLLPTNKQYEIMDLVLLRDVQPPHITHHHQTPNSLGQFPFRYQGWVESFSGAWTPPPMSNNNTIPRLTALGYGEQTFAAFYPNCRGVFGMCDPEVPPSNELENISYEVYGWYSQPEAEFLTPWVQSFGDGGARKGLDWLKTLQSSIGWTLPDNQNSQLPTRLICYAKTQFNKDKKIKPVSDFPKSFLSPQNKKIAPLKPASPNDGIRLAIGNTSTEALSAYLAGRIAEKKVKEGKIDGATQIDAAQKRIENQLESLNLRNLLPDQSPDFGALFDEARHNSTFKAVSGGRLWTIRPETAKSARQQQLRDITQDALAGRYFLPEDLSERLHLVNQLQKTFNRSNENIRCLKRQIFADWQHYMRASYHDPDENFLPSSALSKFPDIDAAKAHTAKLISLLNLYLAFTGGIQYDETKLNTNADPWSVKSLLANVEADPPTIPDSIDHLIPDNQTEFSEWLGEVKRNPQKLSISLARQIADLLNAIHRDLKNYDTLLRELRTRYSQLQAATTWTYDNSIGLATGLDNWFGKSKPGMVLPEANALNIIQGISGSNRDSLAHDALLNLMKPLAALPSLYLEAAVAPRYYLPKEPVLLLAGPLLKSTDRHGMDNVDGPLLCRPLGSGTNPNEILSDNFFNVLRQYSQNKVNPSDWGWNESNGNPWHTLFFEWEVAIDPVEDNSNVSTFSARYDPNFIRKHYPLENNSSEYTPDFSIGTTAGHSYFSGRSVLTPFAEIKLINEIELYVAELARHYWLLSATDAEKANMPDDDDFWVNYFKSNESAIVRHYDIMHNRAIGILTRNTSLDKSIHELSELHTIITAWDQLKAWRANSAKGLDFIQTQALSGFNEALRMLHKSIQIEIAEPNGYKEYSEFSNEVNNAVGTQNQLAVMPDIDFHPIRNGQLQLYRLRLVDTFGRVLLLADRTVDESALPTIYAPQQMQANEPGTVLLPPRISQPTQLNFRWLSAQNDQVETNSHPDTSPICGWVMANNLDKSLMIYAAQGDPLGYIDRAGTWRTTPGKDVPTQTSGIENQALRRMVDWIISQVSAGNRNTYIPGLINEMEEIMGKIDPANYAQHQARSLLMGRPMALVQATMDLSLKGWPAIHQDTGRFKQVVNGMPYQNDGFTEVSIPIRIGEYYRLNDGVVLYWMDGESGYEGDNYHNPLNGLEINKTLDDPPQRLAILMDPRGLVHCTTGILPTKALSIPSSHYVAALQKLQITFLTTPILSEPGHVHLNLPDEPGFSWSWIEKENGAWSTLTQRPVLLRSKVLAAFVNGADVWSLLFEKGWMDLAEDNPEKAYLRAPGDRTNPDLLPDDKNQQTEIEQKLDRLVLGIVPAITDARFGPAAAIREGWLALTPEKGAWG